MNLYFVLIVCSGISAIAGVQSAAEVLDADAGIVFKKNRERLFGDILYSFCQEKLN